MKELTLAGANAYTGATAVNGGTLSISADNNLGTAPATATPNQLTFDGGTLQTTATFTDPFPDHSGPEVVNNRCDSCHGVNATGPMFGHPVRLPTRRP